MAVERVGFGADGLEEVPKRRFILAMGKGGETRGSLLLCMLVVGMEVWVECGCCGCDVGDGLLMWLLSAGKDWRLRWVG